MTTDRDRAHDALRTVDARQRQASEIATRRGSPRWYLVGVSILVIGYSVFLDLRDLDPGPSSWVARYAVPGVVAVLLVALGVAASRSAGIRLRGPAARSLAGRQCAVAGVWLVVWIVVGTVLRAAHLPWSQTIGGACGLVVALVVGARWLGTRG